MNNNGMLVVVSAPSGCGKDTVFKEIRKKRDDIVESVSATTRKPREGEIDGVNYFFLSEEEFKNLIDNNGLLEYAVYNNCFYGTPVKGVNEAIKNGKICVLIIDVQGAENVKRLYPDSVSIFLVPPSWETLEQRLRARNSEEEEMIQKRLRTIITGLANCGLDSAQTSNDDLRTILDNFLNGGMKTDFGTVIS